MEPRFIGAQPTVYDGDGFVGEADMNEYDNCNSAPPPTPECLGAFDFDDDQDLDLWDYSVLLTLMDQPAGPAAQACLLELERSTINPYFFTGRRLDLINVGPGGLLGATTSGLKQLYYHRARHYDPLHGRFNQRDPSGYADGMNLYEFARSAPVRHSDPLGLQAQVADPKSQEATAQVIVDLWDYTTKYIAEHGYQPTVRELAAQFVSSFCGSGANDEATLRAAELVEHHLVGNGRPFIRSDRGGHWKWIEFMKSRPQLLERARAAFKREADRLYRRETVKGGKFKWEGKKLLIRWTREVDQVRLAESCPMQLTLHQSRWVTFEDEASWDCATRRMKFEDVQITYADDGILKPGIGTPNLQGYMIDDSVWRSIGQALNGAVVVGQVIRPQGYDIEFQWTVDIEMERRAEQWRFVDGWLAESLVPDAPDVTCCAGSRF